MCEIHSAESSTFSLSLSNYRQRDINTDKSNGFNTRSAYYRRANTKPPMWKPNARSSDSFWSCACFNKPVMMTKDHGSDPGCTGGNEAGGLEVMKLGVVMCS